MLKRLCVVCVVIIVSAGSALAQGKMVVGAGWSSSCGLWTQVRKTNSPERGLSEQWVTGYLSAANELDLPDIPDLLKGEDFDRLMAWIDNYCLEHPADRLYQAASRLEGELVRRHPVKTPD
jgi:hypothetical protein